jgi:hypothetical protein
LICLLYEVTQWLFQASAFPLNSAQTVFEAGISAICRFIKSTPIHQVSEPNKLECWSALNQLLKGFRQNLIGISASLS